MSAVPIIMMTMMMQHHHRMMEESNRRMREDEARRRRQREEEERRRKKEHEEMVEHRKNSPVIYNGESWQEDRCVKAFSKQLSVQRLIRAIEETIPTVIEAEEKRYDEKIQEVGYEYTSIKKDLDSDIVALRESGVIISGDHYKLQRLAPTDTLMPKIEQITESYGGIFTIMNGQPIELNPSILTTRKYFEERYQDLDPKEVEQELMEINLKMRKYQRFGKYFSFLLNTKKYVELDSRAEKLSARHDECEIRRKEMESFKSLTKEQLLAIKSYFAHLEQLENVSKKISSLFSEKKALRYKDNKDVYDLAIKELIACGEYDSLLADISNYIRKIHSNEPATMEQALVLVQGEYPIEISRRFIYDLIIANLKDYKKEDVHQLKRS